MWVPSASRTALIVRADATIFKDVVQKLTGKLDGSAHKLRRKATASRGSQFKLQERRRHSVRDLEMIKRGVMKSMGSSSPGKTQSNAASSPVKSPTTPVGYQVERVKTGSSPSEEERAENYLHALPEKAEPPVLLTLFPLTSSKLES